MFYHSLLSDWNNGNAHFLRGVAADLLSRGHDVRIYEPENAWSLANLRAEYGDSPIQAFHRTYPMLDSTRYALESLDLDVATDGADLVIVHEWNDQSLVKRLGRHRRHSGSYRLLFHDTHHRSITQPESIAACDLKDYDGVLAFGDIVRDRYLSNGWADQAWTWHEAADTRIFNPVPSPVCEGDLVWIGNWGDEERTEELKEYLLAPVKALGANARAYGVRYPEHGRAAFAETGIEFGGWLANFMVPMVFGRFRATVHIPRRPYVKALPGIPTIRPFEALACGIPLVCSYWEVSEGLFAPGKDFLVARSGAEMIRHLRDILNDGEMGRELAAHGRRTILERHTCAHRVDALLSVCETLGITEGSTTDPVRQWSAQ
jgi:spore maturation protein CgeB